MKNFTENEPIKTSKNDRAEHRLAPCRGNLAKRIAAVALAGAMTVPIMLCLGACNITFTRNPDGTITVGPSGGTTTDPTPGKDDDTESNLSKYSDILKTVLTGDYYNYVIAESAIPNGHDCDDQNIKAYPYRFLEKQGHDVDKIRLGELECTSAAYIIGNDTNTLRLATHVENESASGNYYTHYILEYKLTNQEYKDMYMLFDGKYIQAPLFIQELDYQKEAKVISAYNIDKTLYAKLKKRIYIGLNDLFASSNYTIPYDLVEVKDAKHVTFAIRDAVVNENLNMIIPNQKIKYLKLEFRASNYENAVFRAIDDWCNTENPDEFNSQSTTITYFAINAYYNITRVLENLPA